MKFCTLELSCYTVLYIACLSTDGDDVLATAPLDSALVSEVAGSTRSDTNDKEPGDKTGVYL